MVFVIMDDENEASRDPGAYTSHLGYTDEDFELHRAHTVCIGLHVPTYRRRLHHHHHKRHRHHHHHHRSRENSIQEPSLNREESYRPVTPPAERVQFILGEDEDGSHEPHPIFSEMEELYIDGEEVEWRETARWVKFEEDVEEGGNRWSKPHVATLSLHSLFELRSHILSGLVLLDLEATSLDQISDRIAEKMVECGYLQQDDKEMLKEILLQKHKHQHERRHDWTERGSRIPLLGSLAEIGRISSKGIFGSYYHPEKDGGGSPPVTPFTPVAGDGKPNFSKYLLFTGSSINASNEDIPETSSSSSLHSAELQHRLNQAFMKKIPPGAEASNLLIGETDFIERAVFVIVRLSQAHRLGDLTEVPIPTRFLFILLGPNGNNKERYHEVGRAMATLMSDEVFHDVAYKAKSCQDLISGIDEFLDAVTVLPPGAWDPTIRIEPPQQLPSQESRKNPDFQEPKLEPNEEDEREREENGLKRTGRLFGGLINDIKRKRPWYLSDFTDGFAVQSVASIAYLYFAGLAPIVTFGGLLGEATKKRIAAMESLLSGAICGIVYGLFSGQPLTILGSTGPVLVFETIIFDLCTEYNWDYLSLRLWIGMWVSLILIICVALDASVLVCYITRFTEENFATLISLIFIYKSFEKVINIGYKYPVATLPTQNVTQECFCEYEGGIVTSVTGSNWTSLNIMRENCKKYEGTLVGDGCNMPIYVPDVFLFSIILFGATFVFSVILKKFNSTPFFPTKVRQVISDFSVVIAIVIMTAVDSFVCIDTPKLEVPQEFKPTSSKRGWVIPLLGNNPWWTAIMAALPALVATILIFMDQQITAVIVNRKENKLKKGCGYHLDLFVLAILIAVCSVLGLPWFVAATVLSMTHVNSLKMESECSAPGEKPQFLGVREQRVTSIFIFILVGLSVFFTPVLKRIPKPVLFGVFLYMGVSSLKGSQLFDRILIIFMPQKYQPDYMFLRYVPTWRIHFYTAIQVICLGLLWLLKSYKYTSISFPVMLIVMIIIRKLLEFIFTKNELKILDDVLPEIIKRSRDDKKRAEEEEMRKKQQEKGPKKSNGNISLSNGILTIDVEKLKDDHGQCFMNISEQLTQSDLWRSIDQKTQNSSPLFQANPPVFQLAMPNKKRRFSNKKETKMDEQGYLSTLEEDDAKLSTVGESSLQISADHSKHELSNDGHKEKSETRV